MFVEPTEEVQTSKTFYKKLHIYLNAVDSQFYRLQLYGKKLPSCVAVKAPIPDITHIFNNGAMLAVSHAIEDLADETSKGELIVTFQDLKKFLPRRQRYIQMAKKLNSIRIWGKGTPPANCPNIDFVPVFHTAVLRYWVVLFTSPKVNAVLVGREINKAADMTKRYFAGFYSLNPFVIQSLRRNFALMSSGLEGSVQNWEKKCRFSAISPQNLKKILANATYDPVESYHSSRHSFLRV